MKLYLVHCGFYDLELCDGVFESHVNLLVAADSFENARKRVRDEPDFQRRRMHVDGLQEVALVSGHRILLEREPEALPVTRLIGSRHRDL